MSVNTQRIYKDMLASPVFRCFFIGGKTFLRGLAARNWFINSLDFITYNMISQETMGEFKYILGGGWKYSLFSPLPGE